MVKQNPADKKKKRHKKTPRKFSPGLFEKSHGRKTDRPEFGEAAKVQTFKAKGPTKMEVELNAGIDIRDKGYARSRVTLKWCEACDDWTPEDWHAHHAEKHPYQ